MAFIRAKKKGEYVYYELLKSVRKGKRVFHKRLQWFGRVKPKDLSKLESKYKIKIKR